MKEKTYRMGADIGGTFTDIVFQDSDGDVCFRKVLSTPPHYDQAVVDGVGELLSDELPEDAGRLLGEVIHGTTVATNAVLERRGARTALVTTAGFRDVLELRRMRMPHMYDPFWNKPDPLIERHLRFELSERMSSDGTVLKPIDEGEARRLVVTLREAGVEAVAVCFLHAYRNPANEERFGAILREELPSVVVCLSSEILREQREYERTATTAVNAYVAPVMRNYVADLASGLNKVGVSASLMIMQSSGGVMTGETAALRPVFALESGPAAGVVASLALAQALGLKNVIAFDMGGTTAKASLIENGRVSRSREYEVGASVSAGHRLLRGGGELVRIPTIDIVEVGAGGGSLAWLDSVGGLQVGPQSSGAIPGPACYGRGGTEPTVTDANLLLGYIRSGPLGDGDLNVSVELAESAVRRIGEPLGLEVIEAARGIRALANAKMMRALRSVSSEKGRNPQDFALLAYGGSGPVHAGALAEELGVTTVVVPRLAGLFSATGLLSARLEFHDVRFCQIDAHAPDLQIIRDLFDEMERHLTDAVGQREPIEWMRTAEVRYKGQMWELEIGFPSGELDTQSLVSLIALFEAEYEQLYGVRLDPGSPVEIRALRLGVLGPPARGQSFIRLVEGRENGIGEGWRRADFGQGTETRILGRDSIGPTDWAGPLLIDEYDTTVVVPPDWAVRRDKTDALVLTCTPS